MAIKIRRAQTSDVQAIAILVHDAYFPYIERIGKPPAPMLENYKEAISKNDVYVAEKKDSICGLIVLKIVDSIFLLDNIAVHPAHQHQGIGKILLKIAEIKALESGFNQITLYTH